MPGAGSILQQNQPLLPPAPSRTDTGLSIEQQGRTPLPAGESFLVSSIELSGNKIFSTVILHALVADSEGTRVTLMQLSQSIARISDYYHSHGYPLTRAIIPAQSVRDGRVRVDVLEARYGQVTLDNHSRVTDPLLQSTLSALQSGQAIDDAPLNRTLLLLSDVPGVIVIATLKPGEVVGTSDLQVQTEATSAMSSNVVIDNTGNRYTGRGQLGGTVSLIDPAQHGDVLSLTGLTSGDMSYGSLSYESLLNGEGTRVGGAYSALHYVLGAPLAALDGHGSAEIESVWARHPFVRSATFNLYAQLQYDHKQLDDAIGVSDLHTDRHMDNVIASVSGDLRDTWLSGGVNSWSAGWTLGHVGFDDVNARSADAATADTQGRFSLWNASVSRLQRLGASDSLYLTVVGQLSNANLDPAEKMVAGGFYTVRAYDVGVLSGDTGVLLSAEWRHELGVVWYGALQLIAFVDTEHVQIDHSTWAAGTDSATLRGAGVGCNWSWPGQWNAKAYVALPLGPTPTLVGDNNSARVWLALSKQL